MSKLVTTKAGWNNFAFGDVVRQVKDKVDPEESGLERYIAGEHMETDNLRITRWGEIGDGYLGPAFHMRFKPGHVLYGSRRTYLRKVALAEFEGITANTTYVLESKDPAVLLPELLPFIMQTELFHAHSKRESKGSVNPYVNFSDLEWYEFALPPIEEQQRIAGVLRAAELATQGFTMAIQASEAVLSSMVNDAVENDSHVSGATRWEEKQLGELADITKLAGFEYTKHVKYRKDGEIIAIRPLNIKNGQLILDDIQTIDRATSDLLPRSKVYSGDVLITYIGAYVGELLLIEDDDRFHLAPNIARIRSHGEIKPRLLEILLRESPVQRQIQSFTKATATPSLTMGDLRRIRVRYPLRLEDQTQLFRTLNQARSGTVLIKQHQLALSQFKSNLISTTLGAA